MNKIIPSKLLPHIIAVITFLLVSFAYFPQVLENKTLSQSDVMWWKGMSKEMDDYKKETGKHALWTNSMFSGMPTYLISTPSSKNLLIKFHNFISINHLRPVSFIFLMMLGFYVTLLIFRVNPWLSIAGAIAYALSTNFLVLIEAGHMTKVMALGYMPPIIGGIYLAYRRNLIQGAIITCIALSIQLAVNHLQMTYYTFLIVLVLGIIELVQAVRNKEYSGFLKSTAVLIVAVLLAVSTNLSNFWLTYEYSKYSMRGKPELTDNQENKTGGLDRDYVTRWSYSIDEPLTLLIPNFKGGASGAPIGENSESYKLFERAQGAKYASQVTKALPLYWGGQPNTAGPAYAGAGIFFLFVLSLFLLKGPDKWWLFSITVLSVLLSYGHYFMFLTDLFLDYFPGYNKFRDVTMTIVIAQFTLPLMGLLVFQKVLSDDIKNPEFLKALKYSLYIVGGICLFFALMPGALYNFSSSSDAQYSGQGMQPLVDALVADRKMMLRNDSLRSLLFTGATAAIVYFMFTKKLKLSYAAGAIAILFLFDLGGVGRRYLNKDDFVAKRQTRETFQPNQADLSILQDKSLSYRVYDLTSSPFMNSRTSYFHKSIGGYHGAKMQRYQDLIERYLARNDMKVLSMLNTKYFIVPSQDKNPPIAQRNPNPDGNAWFADRYSFVESADEEIKRLGEIEPKEEAIVDIRFMDQLEGLIIIPDSLAKIELTSYNPDQLSYEYSAASDQLALFSEVYYDKGWEASIDGQSSDYFRANYILRGMLVPAGDHRITFEFRPKAYYLGGTVSLISSLLVVLFVLAYGIILFRKQPETND